jgi:hypothetical protein
LIKFFLHLLCLLPIIMNEHTHIFVNIFRPP